MAEPLKKITVKDFQSIANQTVQLGERDGGGGLTLVVGPSSTGKSAMLRAAKLLAHNGASVPVRVGAKKTNVAVTFESGTEVGIERGKSLSTFHIGNEKYQKAGTSVPSDVEKFLGLYEGAHFAFQFDIPYLLGEPGSTVTKVLGEITNAHVLTEAVREGSRRRQGSAALARTRRGDADEALERLKGFVGLSARESALEAADEALEAAEEVFKAAEQIVAEADYLLTLYDRLTDLKKKADAAPDVTEDIAEAREMVRQANLMQDAARWLGETKARVDSLRSEAEGLQEESAGLRSKREALLKELGVCPVCGSDTGEGSHVE